MRDESQLILSEYAWGMRLFGALLAAAGLAGMVVMLFSLGHTSITVGNQPPRPSTPEDAWLPGILVVIGGAIMLARYSDVISSERRTRVTIMGWGPWFRRQETSLADVTCIDLGPEEERGSGKSRHMVIPILAIRPVGSIELDLAQTTVEARQTAERIARALALPVGTALSGGSGLRSVEVLELPVTQVAEVTDSELSPPPDTRVRTEDLVQGIEIRLLADPGAGLVIVGSRGVLLLVIVLLWRLFWFHGLRGAPTSSPFLFLSYAPLVACIPVLISMAKAGLPAFFGNRIQVDAQQGLRAAGRLVPPERIRAIEVLGAGEGIKVVLDRSEFIIASRASDGDLRWIRALILRHLKN